jgi:pilus assembly protein Flp/PilA
MDMLNRRRGMANMSCHEPDNTIAIPICSGGDIFAISRSEENSMNYLALRIRHFLASEDGPTAVEYAVMLALIVIVCLTAIQAVGTNAQTTFTNVGNSLASGS